MTLFLEIFIQFFSEIVLSTCIWLGNKLVYGPINHPSSERYRLAARGFALTITLWMTLVLRGYAASMPLWLILPWLLVATPIVFMEYSRGSRKIAYAAWAITALFFWVLAIS